MSTINGGACVVNGTPVDKVFSNGIQVYGRNLLTGTSNDIKSAAGGDWLISTLGQFIYERSQQYTASVYIERHDQPILFQIWQGDVNGKRKAFITGASITELGRTSITLTAPDKNDDETIILQLAWNNGDVSGSYAWRQAKAEKGSSASPWTPAPEDVM